jgi:hypothetical protein
MNPPPKINKKKINNYYCGGGTDYISSDTSQFGCRWMYDTSLDSV